MQETNLEIQNLYNELTQPLLSAMYRLFYKPGNILLDFAPGTNGNFLEYIINRFMFGVTTPDNPFTDLYTVKCSHFPQPYHRERRCLELHWSSTRVDYTSNAGTKLIRIAVPEEDYVARLLYRINQVYRAADVPLFAYSDEIKSQPYTLRKYLHFEFNLLQQSLPWNPHPGPILEIYFIDFYDQTRFLNMLKTIAEFAGSEVSEFDACLPYYKTFLENNHGWVFYNRALQYMNQTILSDGAPTELNTVEEAIVLALCSKEYSRRNPEKINPMNIVHDTMTEFDPNLVKKFLFS